MARKPKRFGVRGEYDVGWIREDDGSWVPLFTRKNLILYSWGYLAAQSLGLGNPAYKVAAAYIEYKNVVNPGDPVPIPAYDRTAGLAYFTTLPVNQDYLRVPLAGFPTIDIAPGFEPYFISGLTGNRVSFVAQSAGSQGVLGRPFSDAALSKIFGITLVATPVLSDPTQDVILSRGYFRMQDQQLKQTGLQLGVHWRIAFE